jgi:hypothetical protein
MIAIGEAPPSDELLRIERMPPCTGCDLAHT